MWRLVGLLLSAVLVHAQQGQQQQPLSDETSSRYPSRDAQLTTYLDPKYPCARERGSDSVVELDLPVNTCASANFTLDGNVLLAYPGLCEGWTRAPYLAIYPSGDCTGEHAHPTWYDGFASMGPGYCLSTAVWGDKGLDVREGQWSIMFQCEEDVAVPEGDIVPLRLPQPPPPPEEKPKPPRPTTASVSDSACYIPGLGAEGHPRFIFQRPAADVCVDVKPRRKLKIYRNALCPDGREALFARFAGPGCREPVDVRPVDESMIATNGPETCLEMGGKGDRASSYTFWCMGEMRGGEEVEESLFPDDVGEGEIRVHYEFGNVRGKTAAVKSEGDVRRGLVVYGSLAVFGVVLGAVLGFLY